MKKYSKMERYIIALADPEEYDVFVCPEHGVYAPRKGTVEKTCAYCKKQGEPLGNAKELYEQYRKELEV